VVREFVDWAKEQRTLDARNVSHHVRTLHESIKAATGCIGKPDITPKNMVVITKLIEESFGAVKVTEDHFKVRDKD